ncbi:MAG: DUF2344 domain-containing protein [Clostridia bacterium]|nr:DUF2344 domain-containing protein [Clostridia bacterium]
MRVWAEFEKGARLRHIGHLDLMRAMQRALRRSGTPVSYSKGYNPHILLSFASALSVGASGAHELMEVELREERTLDQFFTQMNAALPEDLRILRCGRLPDGASPLMSRVAAAGWRMKMIRAEDETALLPAVSDFFARDIIPGQRKTKSGMKDVNLRELIEKANILPDGTIEMILSQEEGKTCKPSMITDAMKEVLGLAALPRMELIRTHLYTRDARGQLVPLEETL